jgi:hypothetical protein
MMFAVLWIHIRLFFFRHLPWLVWLWATLVPVQFIATRNGAFEAGMYAAKWRFWWRFGWVQYYEADPIFDHPFWVTSNWESKHVGPKRATVLVGNLKAQMADFHEGTTK